MTWNLLIDETEIARLLPGEQRRFAKPVAEGLVVFLSGLPPERQAAILGQQMALPRETPLSVRLGQLALQCPVLHKLGQVVARDQRLALELRTQLHQLESFPPSTPLKAIEQRLTEELGPLDQLGIKLNPPAIAEASVAVVVPFASLDGSVDGVFKVLKPGIEQRLEEELSLLDQVGAHLDDQCHRLGIPELDYQESFSQVREKFTWELRLEQEQQHLRRAQAIYGNNPRMLIPQVLDYCTPRVTAMTRVYGCKITDHCLDTAQSTALAAVVTQALVAQPMFSPTPRAMFHSDPHAGNLMITSDGRLAVLDWSLVGELGDRERRALMQIALGALAGSVEKICYALECIANPSTFDREALRSVVEESLHDMPLALPGMKWLVALLDEATRSAKLRVSGDLMLFRKSLLTLEGVLAELGDSGRIGERALLASFARQFASEWPLRWISPPFACSPGTHLSNFDLAEAAAALPWRLSSRLAARGVDALRARISDTAINN